MTVTVDIKKDYALSILEDLEKMGAIDIMTSEKDTGKGIVKQYKAISINLKGYKFDRNEANER
ncbi:MAG TPA: hypothetical protein VGN64_02155 [Dyadobacter sp.]|jgi:hypothetical protein|nr:hypothetical protein [Dyadobacter sp.]